jgi:SAM-dependent methyltransferase
MDDPLLDVREHLRALDGLGRANVVSRTAASLWPHVVRAARQTPGRPLRVLDLACGGGHVAVDLALKARRSGLPVEICGADVSPVAIGRARALANEKQVFVEFVQLDAVRDPLPGGFDLVVSSLFLHHLDEETAIAVIGKMARAARVGGLVTDLRRTRLGYAFAWVGTRLLSRSRVVHVDGARSVRAAFSDEEARGLARAAGLVSASVTRHWPQRWLLAWDRCGTKITPGVITEP